MDMMIRRSIERTTVPLLQHRKQRWWTVVAFLAGALSAWMLCHCTAGCEEDASRYMGCAPYPLLARSMYNDLGYRLRTPDLAIDAIIRVYSERSNASDREVGAVPLDHNDGGGGGGGGGMLQGIVLCHRRDPPRLLAIPGGYVEYAESVEDAVRREVLEETSIVLQPFDTTDANPLCPSSLSTAAVVAHPPPGASCMRQFRVFSNPRRDKRRHTVSVAFDVAVVNATPRAGDDAKECHVYGIPVVEAMLAAANAPQVFAFDHADILRAYLDAFIR